MWFTRTIMRMRSSVSKTRGAESSFDNEYDQGDHVRSPPTFVLADFRAIVALEGWIILTIASLFPPSLRFLSSARKPTVRRHGCYGRVRDASMVLYVVVSTGLLLPYVCVYGGGGGARAACLSVTWSDFNIRK